MKRYDYLGEFLGVVFTIAQTKEIFQIISLIITIISALFSFSFTIYNWYKKAKADGKITTEEIEELKTEIDETIKKGK